MSGDAETTKLSKYLPTLPETHNIAVFVGAMARGKDDFADGVVDHKISISEYPLSASVACGKVRADECARDEACGLTCARMQFCCALEDLWDIV